MDQWRILLPDIKVAIILEVNAVIIISRKNDFLTALAYFNVLYNADGGREGIMAWEEGMAWEGGMDWEGGMAWESGMAWED